MGNKTKMVKSNFKVTTEKGEGVIEDIILSELGFVQIKVKFPNKTYTTYSVTKIGDLLNNTDIKLK